MPRCLALEWDYSEARVAVARYRGREVTIEQAFSVPVVPEQPEQTFSDADVGQRLVAALSERRLTGLDTLLLIGRRSFELRMLNLPPAPDDELPDLVRFQAQGQFSALGSDWTVDFLPISGDVSTPRSVLAAAISPATIKQFISTCESAQLRPRKLLLRSCAAASLLGRQSDSGQSGVRLMVDLPPVEADLTVLMDGAVVFMRTVRLPGEEGSEERAQTLVSEIRRTMAAAHNQLSGQRAEEVVLFGHGSAHDDLRAFIEKNVDLPVRACDPFAQLSLSRAVQKRLPDAGGFAPLLGALLDEAHGERHAIDFLHPREKPKPANRRRLLTICGVAAAVVLLIGAALLWWQFATLDDKIGNLQRQSADLDRYLEEVEQRRAQVDVIDSWSRGEVIWLNELAELSKEFPAAEAAKVDRLIAGTRQRGGGEISLSGVVDKPETINAMENNLRDARHRVLGGGSQQDASDGRYPWLFNERIVLTAPEPDERPAGEPSPDKPRAAAMPEGPAP